ncbi:lipoprotein-releasing system ATP-binding protein [Desulfonatronum thiosulfatophilum]|uniref:Lipoprotein-releasing system ATP-binding protein n=1 Tax=Desulfonatronum thiosulfatophilum TaxID=617002 RepID=A0A1G6C6P4_9BACT|nr:ABC transporter ATP-binding protein [Desulfonatronum thiosulfatophilum]SDB28478.1 lipoprotein-releasing system ATP-binding protein [Desulfonatronum thiosulfatophilum]
MSDALLYEVQGLSKTVRSAVEQLTILKRIDFSLRPGESAAIIGASGSGKSTLLHILGTLDQPTGGKVLFLGKDLSRMNQSEKDCLRNLSIGFVFQFHHLLPEFTTLENVALPGLIAGRSHGWSRREASDALEMVGLGDRKHHRVTTLSGGERQRAAIARALLLKPRVLLADEPTGNLDEEAGSSVKQILMHLNQTLGTSLVVVTHNRDLALAMRHQYELRGGELFSL